MEKPLVFAEQICYPQALLYYLLLAEDLAKNPDLTFNHRSGWVLLRRTAGPGKNLWEWAPYPRDQELPCAHFRIAVTNGKGPIVIHVGYFKGEGITILLRKNIINPISN